MPSKYLALNDASHLAHAELTGVSLEDVRKSWDEGKTVSVTAVTIPVEWPSRHLKTHARGYSDISWDWKSRPDHEDLRDALEPLGIRVYQDPRHEGSDQFGFIFANRDLSAEELAAIGARED